MSRLSEKNNAMNQSSSLLGRAGGRASDVAGKKAYVTESHNNNRTGILRMYKVNASSDPGSHWGGMVGFPCDGFHFSHFILFFSRKDARCTLHVRLTDG